MIVYQLHYKDKLTKLMRKINDSHTFYPKTQIIQKYYYTNIRPKNNILKPARGSCQEGVTIINDKKKMIKHINKYKYKIWLLQSFIPSYLVKLPGDKIGRKMVLRSYVSFKNCTNIFLYKDLITTVFCKEYKNNTNLYQNINLIKQYHTKYNLKINNNKYYHNFEKLFGHKFNIQIWNQIKKICEKIFKVSVKDNSSNKLFGIDWIVDPAKKVWLLEINNNPDICAYNMVIHKNKLKKDIEQLHNFVKLSV